MTVIHHHCRLGSFSLLLDKQRLDLLLQLHVQKNAENVYVVDTFVKNNLNKHTSREAFLFNRSIKLVPNLITNNYHMRNK